MASNRVRSCAQNEILHNGASSSIAKKFIKQNSLHNRATMQAICCGDPAGIRTPDTLLKRQVLCRLSYWIV